MKQRIWFVVSLCTASFASAQVSAPPFSFERFTLPGPVAGALVKVSLTDPRVQLRVALADDRDPDGDGPCVGLLDTTSSAARKHDFSITMNASYFAVPTPREINGRNYSYVVGNCGRPSGWHFSNGRLVSEPSGKGLRATMVVHQDGHVSLNDQLLKLPPDTRYAVSGNAMLLVNGIVVEHERDAIRHPRSAVGLSADGKTFYMIAVDGRQDSWSRGATLSELAQILLSYGAFTALNLDGGGSTAMVLKDPAIGTYSLVNRPSDQSTLKLPVANERPVIDVIGISIAP